ncbi:MAG: hypothetical protein KJO07_05340 [Deltaproteobacteria bacterium]|nr:hypothetical protein [Deltaproteobacteria bacterium]
MRVEIHSVEQLEEFVAEHGNLDGAVVQGLDLRGRAELLACGAGGAVLLGCQVDGDLRGRIFEEGGLVFPRLPDLPYQPYRPSLYTVDELTDGYRRGQPESVKDTADYNIYEHYDRHRHKAPPPILESLAQRLHDHAIDNALAELIHAEDEDRKLVAIMGGHAMKRDQPDYPAVARIGRDLARRGYLVTTGGGPGAMEASHLGAWMASHPDEALDDALAMLASAPSYKDPAWHDTAMDVRDKYPGPADSLGIPTWFYGHEPPNLFATHIAKYFSNSLREDGLLAIAKHGVVYSPGSAGTIQEVFMDAAQNHYGTFHEVSPMVFFGRQYWTEEKPVYPLLQGLAADRQYGQLLTICDDPATVVEFIVSHPPVPYRG